MSVSTCKFCGAELDDAHTDYCSYECMIDWQEGYADYLHDQRKEDRCYC